MTKTTAGARPAFDLKKIGERFEEDDIESLVAFYADDAEIEFDGPGVRRRLRGPIGIREGLERVVASGLKHDLRLAAISYGGACVLDRCRDPRTGRTVAWGGLSIGRGLITHHSIRPHTRSMIQSPGAAGWRRP